MTLFFLFFQLLAVFFPAPQALILKDGRSVAMKGNWGLEKNVFTFTGAHNGWYRLPAGLIDFQRTFAPQPKIQPKTTARTDRGRIPWEHPHFRDKTETMRAVNINNENLYRFASAVPRKRVPPPEKDPRDEETTSGEEGPGKETPREKQMKDGKPGRLKTQNKGTREKTSGTKR